MSAHYNITFMMRDEPEEAVMLHYDGPERENYLVELVKFIETCQSVWRDPGSLAARWIADEASGGYGCEYSVVSHDYDSTADRELLVECVGPGVGPGVRPRVTSRPGDQIHWDDETEMEGAAC